MNTELYIGLMSGTSMDGIDAALLELSDDSFLIRQTYHGAYPNDLKQRLSGLVSNTGHIDSSAFGTLTMQVAHAFAHTTQELLIAAKVRSKDIIAIGSHGQTLLHQPNGKYRHSLQLGDPGTLAVLTEITVVGDFRNSDMALGGQGAPLAPAFHQWAFGRHALPRVVVNIGGIANITLLGKSGRVTGFDTGPGNTLLDAWCSQHLDAPYDNRGRWGAGGTVNSELLETLQADPYFRLPPPKSTGLDYFNTDWLRNRLTELKISPSAQDIQATLAELTATKIAEPLQSVSDLKHVGVCGGGAQNTFLMETLDRLLPECHVTTTEPWGAHPDWVEAAAFAWLARQRINGITSNVPSVTGASGRVSLGGVYLPGNPA